MNFKAQCKGKDINDLPKSAKLQKDSLVYSSTKYDGNYVQIIVDTIRDKVKFFSSGGKEFYVEAYAKDFLKLAKSVPTFGAVVYFEAEWIGNTSGMLGTRELSKGILTTWRTEYAKRIKSIPLKGGVFKVFDYIDVKFFSDRLAILSSLKDIGCVSIVNHIRCTLADATDITEKLVKKGYEGSYLKLATHKQIEGKRVNNAIKLKPRVTYDLLCVSANEGLGKYQGMIGALNLRDKSGRLVSVGSGLSDDLRLNYSKYFVGKVIEIKCERRTNTTYIQPVFIQIREDKKSTEID